MLAGLGGGGGPRYSNADQPTTIAEIYDPTKPIGQRWTAVGDSQIPRLYHSVAILTVNAEVSHASWFWYMLLHTFCSCSSLETRDSRMF